MNLKCSRNVFITVDEPSAVLPAIPDAVASGASRLPRKEEIDLVDKSSLSSGRPSVSSIHVVSSMDKTPSAEREDELCISEELNVTDDDDKGANSLVKLVFCSILRKKYIYM